MPEYLANTEELRNAAKQLQAKGEEMNAAVQAVDSAMNPARGMKSPRITQNIEMWDTLKQQMLAALQEVQQASQIVNQTAADIDTVMS
jgi:hypothetical protein